MNPKNWNLHKVIAAGLLLVIALLGGTFAFVILRDRSRQGSGTSAAVMPSPADKQHAYSKAMATRKALIQELLVALELAGKKSDRAGIAQVSADLVREGKDVIGPALEALNGTREWNYRMALISVLSRVRDPEAVRALENFYLCLTKADRACKLEIVRALERSGTGIVGDTLKRLLSRETDNKVREEIAKALVATGLRPEDLGEMAKPDRALLEKDVVDKQALRSRIEQLDKLDPRSDASLPALEKAALDEKTIAIALVAFRKLEERGDAAAANVLARRVRAKAECSDEKVIQTNALASLSRMKASTARTVIREIVLSDSPELRGQAIGLLGSFGDEAMLPILEQAGRADPGQETRKLIDQAMVAIRSRSAQKGSSGKEGS